MDVFYLPLFLSAFFPKVSHRKGGGLSLSLCLSLSRRHFDERVSSNVSLSFSIVLSLVLVGQNAYRNTTNAFSKMGGSRDSGKRIQSSSSKRGGGKSGGGGLGASLAKAAEKNAHASNVKGQRPGGNINYATRTTIHQKGGMVSVLERDDLTEMMAMAALSNRAFEAERVRYGGGPVVVSLNANKDGTKSNTNNNNSTTTTTTRTGREGEEETMMMEATTTTRAEVERAATTHAKATRIPRRPAWTTTTPVDVLDRSEKEAFLEWRRALAEVEETEKVRLTPFEKNLEIWKQLWRTCELADCVAQIVDARDPMFYRCEDLERYVKELDKGKECVMVLNKADLLHEELRSAWADTFDEMGVKYLFWSAKAATEKIEQDAILEKRTKALARLEAEEKARMREYENASSSTDCDDEGDTDDDARGKDDKEDASSLAAAEQHVTKSKEENSSSSTNSTNNSSSKDPRARVLNRDELLAELERLAVKSARVTRNDPTLYADEQLDFPEHRRDRVVVGFVGYPNVGKSSTVNSLIGTKKTGVSSTPGKTKRYQTLDLGPRLTLADAPGLVFPSFAASRADLVCAGVLPVDRLTDVRVPVAKICERIPRKSLEVALNVTLPKPALHEDQNRQPTAGELLRALCAARGWALVHGRPDDTKAGRYLLKMYAEGRLLHCEKPFESYGGKMGDGIGAGAITEDSQKALIKLQQQSASADATSKTQDLDDIDLADLVADFHARLNDDDPKKVSRRVRPEHKFHKKRKEKRRIKHKGAGENTEVGGQGFLMGKRGGMIPAHLQANVRSAIGDEQ